MPPATSSAGEVIRILAAEMVCVLIMVSAIVIMEEPQIWGGVAETVRFHATEDLPPYVRCTVHAILKESAHACLASGLLIVV